MQIIVALVFIIVSASAYLDDPENTTYLIKNAITNKYLFVEYPTVLPSGGAPARNVCVLDTMNKIPSPIPNALFQIVPNNVLGPYHNIINFGTESTLFGSELVASIEIKNTVNKVMSWNDAEHRNAPEALWNIRSFKNDLYILNVKYGAYLYTNDDKNSTALLGRRRLALLMPSESVGRASGTQWSIIRKSDLVDTRSGLKVEDEEEKGVLGVGVTTEKYLKGKVVAEAIGNLTGVEEKGEGAVEVQVKNVKVEEKTKEEVKEIQMENVTEGEKEKERVQVEIVTEEEKVKEIIKGVQLANVTEGEKVKERVNGSQEVNVTVAEADEKKLRNEPDVKTTIVAPQGFDFKAWALLFNCHTTTSRRPYTTSPFRWYWPYPEEWDKVRSATVGVTTDRPCSGIIGRFRGTTEYDEYEAKELERKEQDKNREVQVENENRTTDMKVGEVKMEWEKEHKK